MLAIHIAGCHGVPDGNGVGREVDGAPFQAENLAAAQAVEGSQLDRKLQRVAFQMEEKLVDFMAVIEAAHEFVLLGPFDPVSRVGRDHVHLDGILERPVDDGMVACLTEDIAAVRELLCRADAENVIRNRLKEIGCDAAANHLRAEMLRAFLGEDIVVTDDGTFCYARDPAGSNVEMIVKSEELTPAQKEATADDIRMNYPNVSILAPATKHFNCHSYAWHHTNEAWNRFWLNDPDPYWQDESYSPANRPSEGDIVYYGTKGFEHSGIVAKKTVRFSVSSQNGAMNVC